MNSTISKTLIFSLLATCLLWVACESPFDWVPATETQEVVDADNYFGLNILRELHEETPDENIFISPSSIAFALGMTYNGAAGSTQQAMATVMGVGDLTVEEVNTANRDLIESLPKLDPKVKLEIANSIWYREAFDVKSDFLKTNKDYYNGEIAPLDFNDPGAKDIINDWVKSNTNNKIDKIIEQINADDVMYLINAIYFKGDWKYKFRESDTQSMPFFLQDGSEKPVDMMNQTEQFNYMSNGKLQGIELPYGNSDFSMVLLLPWNNYGIDSLIGELSSANWDNWMSGMSKQEVLVAMPKFKLEYKAELKDVLVELGMGEAFSDVADFSNIADAALKISKVTHKTFVEVNEKGTEAAAVTSVGIVVTSGPTSITLNRPFIYAIRENSTGTLLFVGKMMDPSQS